MAAAIRWHGTDGGGQWSSHQVGLGHLLHCVTPESRFERQPLVDGSGRFVIAATARLDNRAELLDGLGLGSPSDRPLTDPEIILAAYAAWGEECPARLLGDFAFVVWDVTERKLVCVRDQIGIGPFYYYLSDSRFVFASDLRAVAAHPAVPRRLNESAVALHLRYVHYVMPRETFLANVFKLLPAHVLSVTADGVRERAYWTPESAPAIRLPDEPAYTERMGELLNEAIRCRLRSLHPLGAHVSGGLDSSAVASIAVCQLGKQGRTLAGFSWLWPPTPSDDPNGPGYAARRVASALRITLEEVKITPRSVRTGLDQDISLDGYTDLWYEPLVRAEARARDIRVLLSGYGGDEAVSYDGRGFLAELLLKGRWQRLARLIAARSRGAPHPWRRALGTLYSQVWLQALPAWAPLVRSGADLRRMDRLTGISREFAARTRTLQSGLRDNRRGDVHARQAHCLMRGHLQARIEVWSTQGARDGIEYRYPLLDRRLIEFCLGVPGELFFGTQQGRHLFRQALADVLPDDVRLAELKLELRRVAQYIEVMDAACARWLGAATEDEAYWKQTYAPAARYLDLRWVAQHCRDELAPKERLSRMLGRERQIQVLVMARGSTQG
ncbi:MAG: asparagine synthase-related protein [Acidobacteriota bacterium]